MKKFFTLIKNYSHQEQGNLFILFLMMMVLMVGALGLGIDTAANVYARNSIQLALDNATLTAATRANAGGGAGNIASLNQAQACQEVWQTYDANRPGVRTAGLKPSPTYNNGNYLKVSCSVSSDARTITANGVPSQYVQATITEKRNNFFLQALGIPEQTLNVSSRSRLATSYEVR